MFKKYKTGVGISIDGRNEFRGTGTIEERKKQTAKILNTINLLREEDVSTSVITVIHKKNALGDRREILKNWILELNNKKIGGRMNPCCCGKEDIDLTPEESADFYSDMFYFLLRNGVGGWSPWKDMINSRLQREPVVCVFKPCDPYSTPSCTPVFDDGGYGVCLRLYTDGKIYQRSDKRTDLRTSVLRQTDCKGCPWWKNCYGGCVGLSIDFDWRNKDRFCLMYKTIFKNIENVLKSLQIKPKKKPERIEKAQSRGEDHTDGIEHIDGESRHLDSDIDQLWEDFSPNDHQDGIEHIDGDTRYLDSG
jgi:radical SAM protein with 4Fe4S-binding SPASM domain